MGTRRHVRSIYMSLLSMLLVVAFVATTAGYAAETTKPFSGKAVNGGTVTHAVQGGKSVLTLSKDFQVPGSPDPHWQVVDSKGTVYLLDRLKLKDDKIKTTITIPAYVRDIARVQMWCAWAEVVLGDAPFSAPVRTAAK